MPRTPEEEILPLCNKYYTVGEDGLYYKIWRKGLRKDCVGKRVGNSHHSGYCFVKINGYLYGEHRLVWLMVTGNPAPEEIDHEDGEKSNNSFKNLRLASRGTNCSNRSGWSKSGSDFKGVYPSKRGKPWEAQITVDSSSIYLGRYASQEEAAKAYDQAAIKYKGEYAKLNFERSDYEN